MRPCFTASARPARKSRSGRVPRLSGSAITAPGGWKAPTRFFPFGGIHAGLAADRRVEHGEQRGRDLQVGHPSHVGGGDEPGQIAGHAASQGDEAAIPAKAALEQPIRKAGPGVPTLRFSPAGKVSVSPVHCPEPKRPDWYSSRPSRPPAWRPGVLADAGARARRVAPSDARLDVNRVAAQRVSYDHGSVTWAVAFTRLPGHVAHARPMVGQTGQREEEVGQAVEVHQEWGRHVAALGQADHTPLGSAADGPRQV